MSAARDATIFDAYLHIIIFMIFRNYDAMFDLMVMDVIYKLESN